MAETETAPLVAEVSTIGFPETVVAAGLPVVVFFHNRRCAVCKLFTSVMEELAKEFIGRVTFVKVDADAESSLTRAFGICSLPSLIFYRNGLPKDLLAGQKSKADLLDWIDNHLATP